MNEMMISQFRKQLEKERRDLLRTTEHISAEARSFGKDDPQDPGDQSVFHYSREQLFLQGSRSRALLQLIEAALERIHEGIFGECLECEKQIGVRRLLALPWTQYCIQCQERLEVQPDPWTTSKQAPPRRAA